MRYCCIATAHALLLHRYCSCATAASLLLHRYCSCATAHALLLMRYCSCATAASLLLHRYCSRATAHALLLHRNCSCATAASLLLMRYRYIAAPAVVHTLQAGFLVHPADSKYAELHTDLSLLQPGGPERAMLEHYLLVGGLGFRVLTRTAFLICQLRLLHKECPPAGGGTCVGGAHSSGTCLPVGQ